MIEILYILLLVAMFQAYQIWRLQRNYEDLVDLVVGLHLGDIKIEEDSEDEY